MTELVGTESEEYVDRCIDLVVHGKRTKLYRDDVLSQYFHEEQHLIRHDRRTHDDVENVGEDDDADETDDDGNDPTTMDTHDVRMLMDAYDLSMADKKSKDDVTLCEMDTDLQEEELNKERFGILETEIEQKRACYSSSGGAGVEGHPENEEQQPSVSFSKEDDKDFLMDAEHEVVMVSGTSATTRACFILVLSPYSMCAKAH